MTPATPMGVGALSHAEIRLPNGQARRGGRWISAMRAIDTRRNIGILAHVDAGKTTLTERMLFAGGRIHCMGEVHDGTSTMDTRDVERRHGVTVSAAATSLDWAEHRISLLDTPGHVDFTQEVERALLAIDAAVVLFSGVSGVEPQTETVWRQTARFGLPRIGFVNKLDATGADFEAVLTAIRTRLGVRPASVQWPVMVGDRLAGIVNLIDERWLTWPRDEVVAGSREALLPAVSPVPDRFREEAVHRRAALVEAVVEAIGDRDDAALADYLDGVRFDGDRLRRLVRQACLSGDVLPVLGGAAYRDIGVTPLLDAIVAFAPSPLDRGSVSGIDPKTGERCDRAPDPAAPVSAMVSKVAVTRFGLMATVRVISGRLTRDTRVVNATTGTDERIGRVLAVHADETVEIDEARAGDIVAVAGLKGVGAGDSLADPRAPIVFAGMGRVEPVIEAAVEPVSASDQVRLGPALAAMVREDPSLRVTTDADTGDLLLAGMGELHLQIALEALAVERGVAARIGPPRIAYREAISRRAQVTHTLRKQSGGPGQFAKLTLSIEPLGPDEQGLIFENRTVGGAIPSEYVPAIKASLREALSEGGLAGYPVVGAKAMLLDGAHHPNDSSSLAFANAARQAFREAYVQADPYLLEPLARVDVCVPEQSVGAVIGDLQARRGTVLQVEPDLGQAGANRISAEAPLANLWGYVGVLRSLTRGHGQATVSFARYASVPAGVAEAVISKLA